MANGLPLNTSSIFAGLGTATFTVVTAGLYTCAFTSTIPYIASGSSSSSSAAAPSALSVVVNQNGSAKLTVNTPGATQPMMAGKVVMSCAVNDVITVVMSSANVADNALNAVQTTINLYQGE